MIIKSCSSGNDSEFQSNTELDNPETQSNAAVASTVLLGDVDPLLYDEGDSFYTLDSVLDATGETWNNVVHPGSTGTTGGTGGMGAHKAKGFNRTYTNNMYSHFSGTIFLNREYVLYTDHILTLLFEVYGDNSLLYRAPYLETGIEQCAFSFDIDIHKYSKIRIHFEVINDSGMFSWEDCIFGISNATFSLKPISELNVPFVEDKTEYITKPAELGLELKNATPLLSENGDSFYSEFSVTDCNGITYTDVVHPGSTGTTGSTRGMGAHEAKGFNRTYLNENYSTFSGTLFLSDAYAHYTNHTLTLLFEIYGDGGLIYSAPALTTGKVQSQVDVNIDITNYSKITIHFEAINDTNMFSWEDCVFGISNACFK